MSTDYKSKKTVVVGLSGGVDSAIAAYLLKKQGYNVIAVFMRNWDSQLNNDVLGNPNDPNNQCPQEYDYSDAIKVAEALDIPIHRVDFIEEYWNQVFKVFIESYKNGWTPNPDIWCNKYIKFDHFINYAKTKFKADYIATGHYAGVGYNSQTNSYELLVPKDKAKDQTYFLSQLNQKQLKFTLFPLYNFLKAEVREIANKLNLVVANKKDSTGICFIGERKFKEFLKNYIVSQPGEIRLASDNRVLGNHEGVIYYTLGQHRGLNLGGQETQYYVVKKDIANNILYVDTKENQQKYAIKTCYGTQTNWINPIKPIDPVKCKVRIRYRQKPVNCELTFQSPTEIKAKFEEPIIAVTPGQAIVFYANEVCLGGAIISETTKQ